MEFVKMMDYLDAQLNEDKTFMDRFLNDKILSTKKYKRACRNRDRWLTWYHKALDEVLKDEIRRNLKRCEIYLDKLLYHGYTYGQLKMKYNGWKYEN